LLRGFIGLCLWLLGTFLAVEFEGVLDVGHDLAAFLFDGRLEPALLPFAGGLVADVEQVGDAFDAVDETAGEGGAFFGFGSCCRLRLGLDFQGGQVLLENFDEFLDSEVEDVGFRVCFHNVSFVNDVSGCKGNDLTINKIWITVRLTVTHYVMSGNRVITPGRRP